ncbi:MAG: hypothetical protein JWQ81_6443 [Amycolatopsis sp.]|uniref:TNT domain-containing protein n=1 Tax=Amycolatopsis sp. TaxID=37632 RepID=UPI0026292C19|nr:TNT domain-containing protein [Amycolatopsis sp.]MCU1685704.1 hypothetical protein [Amycolatopsis sp.]
MRYRVDSQTRSDGLYAAWGERVFRTQRSTADGTLLLVVPAGENPPDGFDVEWNDSPAKVVPEGETSSNFSLETHCLYDDEIYQVAPETAANELTLRWTGLDETRAHELGLVNFSVAVPPAAVLAIWQTRHDFDTVSDVRPEPGTGDQTALLRGIGRSLLGVLPSNWQRVAAQFRQVGDYAELEVHVVCEGEISVSLAAPPRLSGLFAQLRSAMYTPAAGTWFQGTFLLGPGSSFDFDFDPDAEPKWRLPPNEGGRPNPRAYAMELARFPREAKNLPVWLSVKAGRPLDVAFRLAKVVDAHNEGERPMVNRAPVPPDKVRGVLDYLFRAPVALARPGMLPDIFAPQGPPDVPDAFHTDGTWIWAASVPHYLRKYGVPPEPELLGHMQANGFRTPYVSPRLRATAEAEILGQPYPAQQPVDLLDDSVPAKIDREGEPGPELRASDALTVLHQRLAEYGVAESAYRIGEPETATDGVWLLRKAEAGWEVSRPPTDEPLFFAHLEQAARFFLGTVLLYPARAWAGTEPDPREVVADWPITALRGEPPLTFFHGKRIVVLEAGTTVQRFGNETGNLVHPESARFTETSLAYERERERRLYLLQRPLRVLTGLTAPWNGMPGGAVAYLLPGPIGRHLETGALSRV